MGPLRSDRGRMEMPCLGRGRWAPFQDFLPNLTKVSGRPHTSHWPCAWWGSLGQPGALTARSSRHLPS